MSIKKGSKTIAVSSLIPLWGGIEGTLSDQVDLSNALDEKLDKDSGELSGTPTAPTATKGTYNNQIATTLFVKNALDDVSTLPEQEGHAGQFLKTDGTSPSWATVDALPSQTGMSGKFLTTNGTTASWGDVNLDSKLDKITSTSTSDRVYVVTTTGSNTTYDISSDTTTASTIVRRNTNGEIITASPTTDNSAVNKSYLTTNYEIASNVLKTSTDQEFTGTKKAKTSTGIAFHSDTAISAPSQTDGVIQQIESTDKNDKVISSINTKINSIGSVAELVVKSYDSGTLKQTATISVTATQTGVTTSAPAPTEDTTSSTQIDTVGARNTKITSSIGNGTITIQKNGTDVDSFTTNQSDNKSINIAVPTSATDISYSNPTYTTVAAALDKLLYVNPSITAFTGGGTYEIGTSISKINFAWTINKTITSQSINNGVGALDASLRSYTYTPSTAISSNTTYRLTVSDGTNSTYRDTALYFRPKRYWGTSTKTTLTDSEIIALSKELTTSRTQTRTFDCSGGKYFYFAIPTNLCSGIGFKVGGLSFSDYNVVTRDFVNESGYTQSYNIYRPNNIQTGSSIVVEVT